MDAKQRPSAKELLRHRWIRSAKKTQALVSLVERYERIQRERPSEEATHHARRAKPAYSAPAVLAPDGSWDFGPSPDPGWDFGAGAPGAPPLAAAAAAAKGDIALDESGDAEQRARQPPMPPPPVAQEHEPPEQLHVLSFEHPHGQGHGQQPPQALQLRRHGAHSSGRSRHGGSSSSRESHRSSASSSRSSDTASSVENSPFGSSTPSCVPLVVAPVLARMLGVHQDKQVRCTGLEPRARSQYGAQLPKPKRSCEWCLWQVQKAIAQLKLAFDNLEKQRPALSRDVLMQVRCARLLLCVCGLHALLDVLTRVLGRVLPIILTGHAPGIIGVHRCLSLLSRQRIRR